MKKLGILFFVWYSLNSISAQILFIPSYGSGIRNVVEGDNGIGIGTNDTDQNLNVHDAKSGSPAVKVSSPNAGLFLGVADFHQYWAPQAYTVD